MEPSTTPLHSSPHHTSSLPPPHADRELLSASEESLSSRIIDSFSTNDSSDPPLQHCGSAHGHQHIAWSLGAWKHRQHIPKLHPSLKPTNNRVKSKSICRDSLVTVKKCAESHFNTFLPFHLLLLCCISRYCASVQHSLWTELPVPKEILPKTYTQWLFLEGFQRGGWMHTLIIMSSAPGVTPSWIIA